MEMVRYCPVCDDEFRPHITVCSDCGGPLVLQKEGLGAEGVRAASISDDGTDEDEPPAGWRTSLDVLPVSNLLPIRSFDALRDLEPAVSALAGAQVPSRVLVQNGRFILLIRPEDRADAQEALQDAHPDPADLPPPGDSTFDTASGRYSHCPACGSALGKESPAACPECGLELGGPAGPSDPPEGE